METTSRLLNRLGKIAFWLFILGCVGVIAVIGVFSYYSKELPSTAELKNYYPKTSTRLYDAKGGLLAEFAEEKRVFVPIGYIPQRVKNAFIAAEDQNFYEHGGVDLMGILRAVVKNTAAKVTGSGAISGASTITQQVVKNILLSKEKTYTRKIKEAILAVRVTKSIPKDKILEIYLNEIFLGNRSYGVVSAAYNYFNKSINELTIEEAALLAAMPKAPSQFDPKRNYKRALERRNWVIDRMLEENFVTKAEAAAAKEKPIALAEGKEKQIVTGYFAEEVRRWLVDKYGEDVVYREGLIVQTTLDPRLQGIAEQALFNGIVSYDRRHGWRLPIAHIDDVDLWQELLAGVKDPKEIGPWRLAAVLSVTDKKAEIGLKDGTTSFIPYDEVKWARKWYQGQLFGGQPASVKAVLKVGDVVAVSQKKDEKGNLKFYSLEQIPDINGAMMAMDQNTGRVLAMVGGYTYGDSSFNRATQAKRQPGSSFKPFVYLAALENGFLPSTIINDGPITVPQGPGMPMWSPKNYSNDYLGRIPLRTGLAKSRNNVTVLMSLMLGVDKVQEMAKRMGILDDPQPYYSMVLGAAETTLLRMTTGYSMIANNGKKLDPIFVDRVQDRTGKTIYVSDKRQCSGCKGDIADQMPEIIDNRPQIVDPATTYQLITMLEDVVKYGTSTKALILKRPVAGKTGTTNDSLDTWFMGISPDMVVGTYIGFDQPKTMGKDATGASVPLPVFIEFMQQALKDVPAKPFKIPAGVRFQKIDTRTGKLANEFSDPSATKLEVINPKAPQQIQYSDEYRQRFLGQYDDGYYGTTDPASPQGGGTLDGQGGGAAPSGGGGGASPADSGIY